MNLTLLFALMIDLSAVGVCLFAWWRGGPAEQWGSTINLIAGAGAILARYILHHDSLDVALLFADGVLAFGLLLLGVRYASLWIGAAMILQAVQFLLHTYYFVLELRHDRLFSFVNNLVSLGMLICMVAGAMLSWRRRILNQPASAI
jgi:heme/copper-type cytochrome/quinol oxidase subunit 4